VFAGLVLEQEGQKMQVNEFLKPDVRKGVLFMMILYLHATALSVKTGNVENLPQSLIPETLLSERTVSIILNPMFVLWLLLNYVVSCAIVWIHDHRNWKGFLKPTKGKVAVAALIFIFSFFIPTGTVSVSIPGTFGFLLLTLAIYLLESYLISCLIVWLWLTVNAKNDHRGNRPGRKSEKRKRVLRVRGKKRKKNR